MEPEHSTFSPVGLPRCGGSDFVSSCLRPDTTSLCDVVLFACGLVYLSLGINCDREVAIRIETRWGNADRIEYEPLSGSERRCGNVHSPSRRKFHAGDRRRSSAFGLILDDDSQLGHARHIAISIGTSKAAVRNGYKIGVWQGLFQCDTPSGHNNQHDAPKYCSSSMRNFSKSFCPHQKKSSSRARAFLVRTSVA